MAGAYSRATTSNSFSRLLLLLTVLPLTLAAFAFILQWRGGVTDPVTRWSPDQQQFPGMSLQQPHHNNQQPSSRSDCTNLFGHTDSLSFPYFRDWKLDFTSDLSPKICVTTSTSAGLEQTLPWIFYHKVMGVSSFLLFVEGKAASPNVSRVLESIPGVEVIFRTRELEEQQARSHAIVIAVSRIWPMTSCFDLFCEVGIEPSNLKLCDCMVIPTEGNLGLDLAWLTVLIVSG